MFVGFALLSFHARVYGKLARRPATSRHRCWWRPFSAGPTGEKPAGWPRVPAPALWPLGRGVFLRRSPPLVLIQAAWPVLPIPVHLDRTTTEIQGWPELGKKAGQMHSQMPNPENTFIAGLRYQTASELAFYVPGPAPGPSPSTNGNGPKRLRLLVGPTTTCGERMRWWSPITPTVGKRACSRSLTGSSRPWR